MVVKLHKKWSLKIVQLIPMTFSQSKLNYHHNLQADLQYISRFAKTSHSDCGFQPFFYILTPRLPNVSHKILKFSRIWQKSRQIKNYSKFTGFRVSTYFEYFYINPLTFYYHIKFAFLNHKKCSEIICTNIQEGFKLHNSHEIHTLCHW